MPRPLGYPVAVPYLHHLGPHHGERFPGATAHMTGLYQNKISVFDGAIRLQVQNGLDLGRWQPAGQDEVETSGDFGASGLPCVGSIRRGTR